MASLWEDVKNAIVDGYVYAADKAEEVSQIGKARIEILSLNRKIARSMSEIGGRVFELVEQDEKASVTDDETIVEHIDRIRGCQSEIKRLEKEIETIKAERETKTAE